MLFIIFIVIAVIAHIFLKKSNICRNIFYVGSNEEAAKHSAINVDRVKIGVYVIISVLSTLAGILSLGRFECSNTGIECWGRNNSNISSRNWWNIFYRRRWQYFRNIFRYCFIEGS